MIGCLQVLRCRQSPRAFFGKMPRWGFVVRASLGARYGANEDDILRCISIFMRCITIFSAQLKVVSTFLRQVQFCMKTSRYSDSQIISIMRQAEAGTPVPELCREAHQYQRELRFQLKFGQFKPIIVISS